MFKAPGLFTLTLALGVAATLASATDCPPAVSGAARKAHPGATVQSCRKESENGTTRYEVKLEGKGGKKLALDVTPEGNILLTEEAVAVSAVPPAVMSALQTKFAGAAPKRAEKQTAADGKVTYELAFSSGGKKKEATFTSDGTFVEEE